MDLLLSGTRLTSGHTRHITARPYTQSLMSFLLLVSFPDFQLVSVLYCQGLGIRLSCHTWQIPDHIANIHTTHPGAKYVNTHHIHSLACWGGKPLKVGQFCVKFFFFLCILLHSGWQPNYSIVVGSKEKASPMTLREPLVQERMRRKSWKKLLSWSV